MQKIELTQARHNDPGYQCRFLSKKSAEYARTVTGQWIIISGTALPRLGIQHVVLC